MKGTVKFYCIDLKAQKFQLVNGFDLKGKYVSVTCHRKYKVLSFEYD